MKKTLREPIYPPRKKYSLTATIMLVFLIVSLSAFQLQAADTTSTRERIFLSFESTSLKEVIVSIESQTPYRFFFNHKTLDTSQEITLKLDDVSIERAVTELLKNSNATFKIKGDQIVIKKNKGNSSFKFNSPGHESKPSVQPGDRSETAGRAMRASSYVQYELTVSGTVRSETGEALPGVNVLIKGTTIGTTTDAEGRYSITVPDGSAVLVFSFIGYVTQEIATGNQSAIDISMAPDVRTLNEVVVIGYGTTTKRELTGAVASVKPEDFNVGPVSDPMQLIQGKVAGLSITRTNGGDPTSGFEIRLRGSSSINASQEPLIVVDGIPGGTLQAISPDDIESIDILKDGSAAAIYGTRGTNGVILITTKRGRKGTVQLDYSTRLSTESLLRKVEVLDADEYRSMKEKFAASGDAIKTGIAGSMIDYGYDTDWYDEITHTPFSQIHNLSLSGGLDKTSYRVSAFYLNHEGILLNSAKKEYRVNMNLNQLAMNERLEFTVQLGLADYNQNPVDYNAVRQVIQRNPTEPVYDDDGSLNEFIGAWQYENPVGILTERIRDNTGSRIFSNFGARFNIADNLKIGAVGAIQVNRTLDGYYEPSYSNPQETAGTFGYASRASSANYTNTFESTLEWDKDFADHHVSAVGGYSFQEFSYEQFSAGNRDFITDDLLYNNLGSGTGINDAQANMSSFKNGSKLVAFFGRANYNLLDKYFLSASIRREGSTKFGANNKWGLFPAISAGWNLSDEAFLSGMSFFDLLKLRVGYGVTGNQGIDPYLSVRRLDASGLFFYNGQFIPGYQPSSNPNPDLKWETKHELNVGLDWAINNRLSGTIDWYRRDTKDLLHGYSVPVPPNLFGTTLANVGTMRNSGIEFTINATAVSTQNLQWNLNFNFDYRRNKLISMSNDYYSLKFRNVGDVGPPGISAWTHQYREGAPVGIIHGLVFEGFSEDGKWIFRDYNPLTGEEDEMIDTNDRDDIGNGIPDFYTGLTSSLKYKRFEFVVMARGMFGHQVINAKRIWHDNPKFLPRNVMKTAMNTPLWDDPQFSSYYVEDGDFLKIDNITLGYTLPVNGSGWIRSGRVFLTSTNAFLITDYSGVDPEIAIGGLEPGNDNRFDYPSTRTYTLGLNLSF